MPFHAKMSLIAKLLTRAKVWSSAKVSPSSKVSPVPLFLYAKRETSDGTQLKDVRHAGQREANVWLQKTRLPGKWKLSNGECQIHSECYNWKPD